MGFVRSCAFRHAVTCFSIATLLIALSGSEGIAQSPGAIVTGEVATPIPWAGHDYNQLLNETVDPSSGSVNFSIIFPAPKSRGTTIPFGYRYSSAGVFAFTQSVTGLPVWVPNPMDNGGNTNCIGSSCIGGWLTVPQPTLTYSAWHYLNHQGESDTGALCQYYSNFTFLDASGESHNLGIGYMVPLSGDSGYDPPTPGACGANGEVFSPGISGQYSAYFADPHLYGPPYSLGDASVYVVDNASGLTYHFQTVSSLSGEQEDFISTVSSAEDRNGNIVRFTGGGGGLIDTAGRPVSTSSDGIDYTVNWGTTTASYSVPANSTISGLSTPCSNGTGTFSVSGTLRVISSIGLPDGTNYSFFYGQNNPNDDTILNSYGLINEIVYPDGGWVKYKWAIPTGQYSEMSVISAPAAQDPQVYGIPGQCEIQYGTPVLVSRTASFDGTTSAQTQTYGYGTTWPAQSSQGGYPFQGDWTAKSTNVSTSITGASYLKTFVYSAMALTRSPMTYSLYAAQVPAEQTVTTYQGSTTATAALSTVTKAWFNQYLLGCEFNQTSGGMVSGHFYGYTLGAQIADDKEYDFGQIASPSTVCVNSGSGSLTAPTSPIPARETVTNYQMTTGQYSGAYVPCQTLVKDGSGPTIAETDRYYDGGTTLCTASSGNTTQVVSGLPTGTHDETSFGPTSTTARGNLSQQVRQNSLGSSSVTTYTYDETGQVLSVTDPCGNTACSDMSGAAHTTQYSYTDSTSTTSSANSAGNSNAYVTTVTRPATNGVSHIEYYKYDYPTGHLVEVDDENTQPTAYDYTDPLNRLTDVYGPPSPQNGGAKAHTNYNYGTPKQVKMTGPTGVTSTTSYDGIGHVTSQSTSDPVGPDTVNTTYNGMGEVSSVTNPFRGTYTSAAGITTYTYDSLGRKTLQTNPDNSTQSWSYVDNTVIFADESLNQWSRATDGLGRLTKVLEPNGRTATASMETDYTYDALNNLISVAQNGASGTDTRRSARFYSYDSLSHLIQSFNPETGWICYGTTNGAVPNGSDCTSGYDANSNLGYKTDARGITTTYYYDALNRPLSKAYSDGTNSACYRYDVAAVTGTVLNPIGRITGEWTQSGPCPGASVTRIPSTAVTAQAFMQYDPMGRLTNESYCTPQSCNYSGKAAAGYDLAGNLTSLTYPDGRTVSQGFDSAGRLDAINYASWNGNPVNGTYFAESPLAIGGVSYSGYDPAGHLTSGTFGNGTTVVASYNSRLELTSLAYSQSSTLWGKTYGWTSNGNLQTTRDSVSGIIRQFGYDTLNRLTLAQDIPGTSTGQSTDSSDESQSNALQNSQMLGGLGWGGNMATLYPNIIPAPDGTTTGLSMSANSGSTDTYAVVNAPNQSLYDNATMTGSVWMRVPSGTLNTYISINDVGDQGSGLSGNVPVTVTTTWQQFTVTGTNQNGLTTLQLRMGGSGTITDGQVVFIWGPQLQLSSTSGTVTNYVPYSQQIGGAFWSPYCSANTSNMTLNTSVIAAPDGTHTATSFTTPSSLTCGETLGTLGAVATVAGGLTAGQTYTTSVWLRGANGGETVGFGLNDCLSTTVVLTTAWERYSLTSPSIASGSSGANCSTGVRGFQVLDNTNVNATFYTWGAQTEVSSSVGQYVATLDSPITVDTNSTNILPSSEQVGGGGWAVYNNSVTANTTAVAAPDGSFTADAVTAPTGGSSFLDYGTNAPLYDGATVTASVYLCVPAGTTLNGLFWYLKGSGGTTTTFSQTVNLTSTWQRFELTGTMPNGMTELILGVGSTTTFSAGQTVYVWGAQIVTGSSAGQPVETTDTTTSVVNGSTVDLAANGLNESYSYDGFGNMLEAGNFNFVQAYTTANQLSGWSYDASGNLLIDGQNNGYAYDAEGRVSGVGTYSGSNGAYTFNPAYNYVYDAEGNRVAKLGGTATDYIYFGGKQLARLAGGQWTDLIYGPTGLLAEVPGTQSSAPVYRMVDHLGTAVGTLSSTGTVLSLTDYAPFGQVFAGGSTDPYKFTGKERDTESGNDYFGARYYASSMGRWMSPDPYGNSVADFGNPQSWNMYSYVLNNPLKYVDPTGLDCAYLNDAGDGIESSDRNSSIGECNSNGGYWVSGQVNQVSVNGNGSYNFGYSGTDADGTIFSLSYANYLGPNTDNSMSSAYAAADNLLNDFLNGTGETVRNYDLSTIEGRNILQSAGIQQLNARIKAGCAAGQQSGPVSLSSGQAAANIPYDAAHSPVGGQVGGYAGGTYTNNGDSTDIKFSNTAGAHSFVYHVSPDRPSGSTGPGRSIIQNFTLSEPNPCTHP